MTEDLVSERLRIEALRSSHASEVHESLQDPRIYTFIPEDPPTPKELQARYDFLERGRSPDGREEWLNWIAFLRDTHTPVGTFQATLTPDKQGTFAYIVFPPFWRQGYGHEMASCALDHLFSHYPIAGLRAEMDTRNQGSVRLVKSLGFIHQGTTVGADYFKGMSSDEFTYATTRESWQERQRRAQGAADL